MGVAVVLGEVDAKRLVDEDFAALFAAWVAAEGHDRVALTPFGSLARQIAERPPEGVALGFFDREPEGPARARDTLDPADWPVVLITSLSYAAEIRDALIAAGVPSASIVLPHALMGHITKNRSDRARASETDNGLELITDVFGEAPIIAATPSSQHYWQGLLEDHAVVTYTGEPIAERLVFMPRAERLKAQLPDDFTGACYTFYANGQIIKTHRLELTRALRHRAEHIFNRLGPRDPLESFYFFPFGYLCHRGGQGDTNPFGHRIHFDVRDLAKRGPDHKVIAFFGASSTWSTHCSDAEMFTSRLEVMLTDWLLANKKETKISVLNFGTPANVVLNEMINYLLHAERLRPDYVVAHDGVADLYYGMLTDPFLLGEHQITYHHLFESWSQMLHGTHHLPTRQPERPFQPINLPDKIISAYINRKLQFQDVVEGRGSRFIWGLQPIIDSKKRLSPDEQAYTRYVAKTDRTYSVVRKQLPVLYDQLLRRVRLPERVRMIDFHTYFNRFDASETLFGDFAHMTAAGDARIAERYLTFFTEELEHAP